MSIKILRWTGGAGGDTILKLLTLSDSSLQSNTKFIDSTDDLKTHIDVPACRQFKYSQIAKMSLYDFNSVDVRLLKQQLSDFDKEHEGDWILKSHCYGIDFEQEVIDIVPTVEYLPFVVSANVVKNSRESGFMQYEHPLVNKIKDPEILYRFDIYNIAKNNLSTSILSSNKQIKLHDTLGGWDSFISAIKQVGLHIDAKFRNSYDAWLLANKKFIPSEKYKSLALANNLDYTSDELSLVEKYCLLAIAGGKFTVNI